jgi:hypothetical protein
MKNILFALVIAGLILGMCSTSFATNHYAVTNNDTIPVNTAWVFKAVAPGGHVRHVATLTATGQSGIGGGYFAVPRNAIASTGTCVFISNAGSSTISSFAPPYTLASVPVGSYGNGSLDGSIGGIGLALSPNGQTLYSAWSESENLATWSVAADCALTLGNIYPEADTVAPLAVTDDGTTLVVPDPPVRLSTVSKSPEADWFLLRSILFPWQPT